MIFAIAVLVLIAAILIALIFSHRRSQHLWEQIAQRAFVSVADRMAVQRACFAGLKNADTTSVVLLREYRLYAAVLHALCVFLLGICIGNIILAIGFGLALVTVARWRLKPLDMTVEVFR